MAIVNFAIAEPFEQEINQTIKKEGFASKAEFFRFAVKDYINRKITSNDISQEEFDRQMGELGKTIHKKLGGKKLPSPEEQLADLL